MGRAHSIKVAACIALSLLISYIYKTIDGHVNTVYQPLDMRHIKMLTGEQIRGALAMLRLRQEELSDRCDLSVPTIQRMAAATGVVPGRLKTVMTVKAALEAAGAVFAADGSVRVDKQ